MKTIYGISRKTKAEESVIEATANIQSPIGLLFFCNYDLLDDVTRLLNEKYPGVPTMGTAGTTYFKETISDSNILIVCAITGGATLDVGVIKRLASSPLSDLYHLSDSVKKVRAERDKTVCLELCTNDEERLVSTMNIVLEKHDIPLVGGTVFGTPAGKVSYVSVNGKLYEDACAYMIIKNDSGKVHVFRENIYDRADGKAHTATKVNLAKKELIELDNRPAADVYADETGLTRDKIVDNVLQAPLGRVVDDEVFISSMYEVTPSGSLICYKRINENDQIYTLKLLDYREINKASIEQMRDMCGNPSLIFSVNCIYRYLLFQNENYLSDFLKGMSQCGPYLGYIGGGEQYKHQHVNQTMVCAIFE